MQVLLETGRDRLTTGPLGLLAGTCPPAAAPVRGTLEAPARPEDLTGHYDLTISHPTSEAAAFTVFRRWLGQEAAARGLSCAWLHEGSAPEAIRRIQQGQLTIGFHLDYFALWHVTEDPYARLAHAIQDAGGRSINLPARSRCYTDKSAAHQELQRHRLGVPATILLRPWRAEAGLTPAERTQLRLDQPGARLYVKPANGFAGRGVIRVDNTEPAGIQAALEAARRYDPRDTYLIQREIHCPLLECADAVARPAYWRLLYCMGELIPFWWSNREREHARPSYRRLTVSEVRRYRLRPVLAYGARLARLCRLDWFSTELCLSEGEEASRFVVHGRDGRDWPVVAIDYVNDQCDVDVQSRWPGAPPDVVVHYLAGRFAEMARCQSQVTTSGGRLLRSAA